MQNFKFHSIKRAAFALALAGAASQAMAQAGGNIVYPGQATAKTAAPGAVGGSAPGSAGALPTQAAQAAQVGQPGQPGGVMAQLPPLPGAPAAPVAPRPGTVAANDIVPPNLAQDATEVKRRLNDFARAQNQSHSTVSRPVTRTITLTQAAGETPALLRLAMGMPSNIVFIDSTGQPWPIDYAVVGDAQKFEVLMPEPGTSSMQLRPTQNFAYGGVSVKLRGNHIPVSFTLTVGQPEVDTRLDVKISRAGPNAAAPIIDRTGQPHASDAALSSFLDGVAPDSAVSVKTSKVGVQAWRWSGKLIVRSDFQVVSPAWSDSTSSPSGVTNAYILPDVPSILVAHEGRLQSVKID